MRAVNESVPKPSASAPMRAKRDSIATIVKDWLSQFEEALVAADQARLKTLFHAESYWRDVLALTWRLKTVSGSDAILRELAAHAGRVRPTDFKIDHRRTPPRNVTRAGTDAIEAIFSFETTQGRGCGVMRLTADADDGNAFKAWTLLTALDEIKGHEERLGRSRPQGKAYSRDFRGPNWLDLRAHLQPLAQLGGLRRALLLEQRAAGEDGISAPQLGDAELQPLSDELRLVLHEPDIDLRGGNESAQAAQIDFQAALVLRGDGALDGDLALQRLLQHLAPRSPAGLSLDAATVRSSAHGDFISGDMEFTLKRLEILFLPMLATQRATLACPKEVIR